MLFSPCHYRFFKGASPILLSSANNKEAHRKRETAKAQKKLAAALILSVAAAISIPLLLPGKPVEETVREREYTATRDTITVGVESSGLVDTTPNAHSFEAGTVVEELLVKVGSEVKKGDPLARLSEEALKEQLEAAQTELSDAKAALQQASSSKDLLISQSDKTKQDGLAGVQQEYAAKAELLQAEKSRLEADIAQPETTLAQLEQQITDTSARRPDWKKKSAACRRRSTGTFWKSAGSMCWCGMKRANLSANRSPPDFPMAGSARFWTAFRKMKSSLCRSDIWDCVKPFILWPSI